MLSSTNWIRWRKALVRNTVSWMVKGLLWEPAWSGLCSAHCGVPPTEIKPLLLLLFSLCCIYFLYCALINVKQGAEQHKAERVWGENGGSEAAEVPLIYWLYARELPQNGLG